MRYLITVLGLSLSLSAMAISEKNFKENYDKLVSPFYWSGITSTIKARDGVRLSYHKINRGNKKLIFIMTGRTEPTSKYAEVVYDLKDLGYDFLLLDIRGQGYSERELADNQKGWVKSYQNYITDIEDLFQETKATQEYSEIVFLGHSMGGAIGLRYSEVHPKTFSKIVVNAPMLELKLNDKNEAVVSVFMRLKKLMGKGKDYIPGGGPTTSEGSFESSKVTSSMPRFEMARQLERDNDDLIMGASTNGWVLEGIKLGKKTFKKRKKLFKTPVLMFQAGDEHFSRYKRQDTLCEQHPSCTKHLLKEGKHELLMENDKIRNFVMNKIKVFLEE